jgi:hypothetical protein
MCRLIQRMPNHSATGSRRPAAGARSATPLSPLRFSRRSTRTAISASSKPCAMRCPASNALSRHICITSKCHRSGPVADESPERFGVRRQQGRQLSEGRQSGLTLRKRNLGSGLRKVRQRRVLFGKGRVDLDHLLGCVAQLLLELGRPLDCRAVITVDGDVGNL